MLLTAMAQPTAHRFAQIVLADTYLAILFSRERQILTSWSVLP